MCPFWGCLINGSGTGNVLYYVTDHLGSVRVVKDGSGAIRQRFDYYPYGTVSRVWTSSSTTDNSEKRYRFGGKEIAGTALTDLTGSGVAPGAPYLDFGARLYSPGTASWLSVDPMAEKYYDHSPYLFCAANPIMYVDPTGESIRIRRNVNDAILDLAHIVATERGAIRVSKLIEALPEYDLIPVPFSCMARFTGKEIRYVTNPFRNRDGGTPSEFVAMGHEINHAYDHSIRILYMHNGRSRGNTDQTESNSVSFENYLRSVYMMPNLRRKYSGKSIGTGSFNPKITRSKGEYVDGFEEIGRNKTETSIGFKYNKHTDSGDQTMFLIVGVDSKDHFYFNQYETEEEYRNAANNW